MRTNHDSVFSKWQILIGPSDWEDYSLGKEGAARYRVHNLPTSSGSGLYELGIAVSHAGLGREIRKLDPHRIVVVYLGQAENVRKRLQSYGRSGAHLGNNTPFGDWNEYKAVSRQIGPALFQEIFSRGYSIVFRWAPMENKREAEKTEVQLLDIFDYAWNKELNSSRRPNDILEKLNKLDSSTNWFQNITRRLQVSRQKKVGVKIEARKLLPFSDECTDEASDNFLAPVFKFSKSRPKLNSTQSQVGLDDKDLFMPTCGVVLGDGFSCRRPPVPGRKRCEEHKGRRIHKCISVSVTDEKSSYVVLASDYNTCGVVLGNEIFCRKPPVPGRKRCEEHKGIRVNGLSAK